MAKTATLRSKPRTPVFKTDRNSEDASLHLSPRQLEILRLLVAGYSTPEIALELEISVKTAETHRANIMRRADAHSQGKNLGRVHNVVRLCQWAVRFGLAEWPIYGGDAA
jgi:DNA-binding NarL/FixJ family response regulator